MSACAKSIKVDERLREEHQVDERVREEHQVDERLREERQAGVSEHW